VALAATLGACASPIPNSAGETSADDCIHVEALSDWQPLDEYHLLLWAPGDGRAHLLMLASPIAALPFTDELDVVDGDLDGLICDVGRDEIFVATGPGGSAPIASIEYLTEERTAELRAASAEMPAAQRADGN
jgi:hypothetical protein